MNECVETACMEAECMGKENSDSDISESSDKIIKLGAHLLPISDIISIYSLDLPSPEDINKILPKGEALETRSFCVPGYCESLETGVSPSGGYVGPHRGVGKHLQAQPFCNCSYPFQTLGPQTTAPIPMSMRPYLYQYGTIGKSSKS